LAGCNPSGGPANSSRAVPDDTPTPGGPGEPGSGGGSGTSVSPIAPVPAEPSAGSPAPGPSGPGLARGARKPPDRGPGGSPPPVPEPLEFLIVGAGLAGLAMMLRRRRAHERSSNE